MIGKELEKKLSYTDVEVGNAVMTAKSVTVANGRVKTIEEGSAKVADKSFTFRAYTNINGMADTREEVLMYEPTAPADINAFELIRQFVAFVESDVR